MNDEPVAASFNPDRDPAELRREVVDLAQAVRTLGHRVTELKRAVDSMNVARKGADAVGRTGSSRPGERTDVESARRLSVVVSPAIELAFAALVENTLRDLPSVEQVIETDHSDRESRFELKVQPDADVKDQMLAALPLKFDVISSSGSELRIAMQPLWS